MAATDRSNPVRTCALPAYRDVLAPQLATHNAHTVAAIMAPAGATRGLQFQRLHGLGESLYRAAARFDGLAPVRVYAPAGATRLRPPAAYAVCHKTAPMPRFVSRVLDARLAPERLPVAPP